MLNEYKKLSLLHLNSQWTILLQSMGQSLCHQGPQTYGIIECIVGFFRLYYFLLTEGIILEPVMRSGSNYPNNFIRGTQLPITQPGRRGLITYATTTMPPVTYSNPPSSPQLWFPVQWHTSHIFNTNPGNTVKIFITTQHYNWNDSTRQLNCMTDDAIISINDNGYQRLV
jgi:hypothetical protein